MHFFSTVMVALGAHFSAIWIVVADSWMQTPAGFHIVNAALRPRAETVDFWAVVFNPSSMVRLSHTVLGAWQAAAFFVLSVSGFYLLKRRHEDFAKASMKIGLIVAVISSLGSLYTGDLSGRVIARYQPAKLAAFEGHFAESAPADLHLFGWVDMDEQRVVGGPRIPGMLSWLVYGDASKPLTGLNAFKPEDRPPVNPVFQSFHIMVAIGMGLIALAVLGLLLWWRGTLFRARWLMGLYVASVLGPQIANQLGWFSAEVGRQPWIVYGLMRTADGVSRNLYAVQILISLVLFTLIYVLLFVLFIFLLDQKIRHGPLDDDLELGYTQR
jgi:cytochrome d ubiquinol oxidase subunit I